MYFYFYFVSSPSRDKALLSLRPDDAGHAHTTPFTQGMPGRRILPSHALTFRLIIIFTWGLGKHSVAHWPLYVM